VKKRNGFFTFFIFNGWFSYGPQQGWQTYMFCLQGDNVDLISNSLFWVNQN